MNTRKRARQSERMRVTSRKRIVAELPPTPAARAGEAVLARNPLHGSLVRYDDPLEPAVAPEDWEVNQ